MTQDPSRIGLQPALTTSTGRSWLVVGGLFTGIALAVLIPLTALPPAGLALAAAIAITVLYLGMIGVRLFVSAGRRRLRLLAVGMLAVAGVALVASAIIAFAAIA